MRQIKPLYADQILNTLIKGNLNGNLKECCFTLKSKSLFRERLMPFSYVSPDRSPKDERF